MGCSVGLENVFSSFSDLNHLILYVGRDVGGGWKDGVDVIDS